MPEPMTGSPHTLADILALDDAALNLLIEAACYGRQWTPWHLFPDGTTNYVRDGPSGHRHFAGQNDFAHTASWDHTMALAWRYGLHVRHSTYPLGTPKRSIERDTAHCGLYPTTEAEARRMLCACAVWVALGEQSPTRPT